MVKTLEFLDGIYDKYNLNDNENANILSSNNLFELRINDNEQKMLAKELLDSYDKQLFTLHENCYYHIHDLGFFISRPNCLFHDIRKILRNGLDVLHTKSKPAKNLMSAVSHIINVASFGQAHCAGGQGLPHMLALLAPLATPEIVLSELELKEYNSGNVDAIQIYKDRIKNALQHFVFQANQISPSRGLQTIFLSLTITAKIPEFLRDEKTGYIVNGDKTFGEFEKEHLLLTKTLLKLLNEGDGNNKPFNFPNTIFIVNEDCLSGIDDELVELLMYNMNNIGNTYLLNNLNYGNKTNAVMGCRTYLDDTLTENPNTDVFSTGNMAYITINLPKLALLEFLDVENSEYDSELTYGYISKVMQNIIKILLIKREIIKQNLKNNLYPLFTNDTYKDENGYYYNIGITSNGIGIVGYDDAVKLTNSFVVDKLMNCIREHINKLNLYTYKELCSMYDVEYVELDGVEEHTRFSMLGSPAESCSYRFKQYDNKIYDKYFKKVGIYDKKYYTNSIMVNELSGITAHSKIIKEQVWHKILDGGIICHLWNATKSDLINYKNQFKYLLKLLKETYVRYITISNIIITCNECNNTFVGGYNDNCCKCGSDNVIRQTKITGYLQNIDGFNEGKKSEVINRGSFKL